MTVINQVDLPMPPSVNRIWRSGKKGEQSGNRVYVSKLYKDWMQQADKRMILDHAMRGKHRIDGPFAATIVFDRAAVTKTSDLDNRAKAVLDYAVSRALIADDRYCERLALEWTTREFAPAGCRLFLEPLAQ